MKPSEELRQAAGLAYYEMKKLFRAMKGRPLSGPPLIATTLDADDARHARKLLRERDGWYDPAQVEAFERSFAAWNGSRQALAFMGGRVALSAIISALGLGPGDEAILPGYTCVVVKNAFEFAGVKPVFCDIELETYGLDASRMEEAITPRTRAVLLHHLYGLVCRDYERILHIARNRGLYVIEDCAQSAGATYRNNRIGNLGDAAFFSMELSKVLTTIQGGIAVTGSEELARGLREYRDSLDYPSESEIARILQNIILDFHCYKSRGRWWKADVVDRYLKDRLIVTTTEGEAQGIKPASYARKMPAPLAQLGANQLFKVDSYNQRRRQGAKRWDAWCDDKGYNKPCVIDGSVPVYLRYPVMVEPEKKLDLRWAREELKLQPGVWFLSHFHPAKDILEGCPNADAAVERCINLPTLLD